MKLNLANLTFKDLRSSEGLQHLDNGFLSYLENKSPALAAQLSCYRAQKDTNKIALSEFLIELAQIVEPYLATLFDISNETKTTQLETISHNPVALFKKHFILQKVKKRLHKPQDLKPFNELHPWLLAQIKAEQEDNELLVAKLALKYLDDTEQYSNEIILLTDWCTQAILSDDGKAFVKDWDSFRLPEKLDYNNLVPLHEDSQALAQEQWHERDGFELTDKRMSARAVQNEINYCIFCHDHDGDLCSKGFPKSKKDKSQGFRQNPLDITLTGCPLEEKISEMNILKRDGHTIGALAMIMLDNPMCPATGHRICNDCMKSCIYQKLTPVNVPQIETRCLTDVLALPWGIEIYDLLTRWNPLRQQQWVTQAYTGKKVMIAGMGPAGFTLAHHLLQEGHAVVGIDGLKIEPLVQQLIDEPIKNFSDLEESLDDRLMAGFGGVAEYGITVRWDKNFLKLIYIHLMRSPHFQLYGNVRFGGTIKVEDAWAMGFHHLVVAVGAGLPKALPVKGSMAPGMRQANDFLMALQLTGAAKKNTLANLQMRLPAIIIGGGLTGVDAATEAKAYYIRQIETIAHRYKTLCQQHSKKHILEKLDITSQEILEEFLTHAQSVNNERKRAQQNNKAPKFNQLINTWGGVSIVYRKKMQQSPAYVNNHEELQEALKEGIYYIENLQPTQINLDKSGHCASTTFELTVVDCEKQQAVTLESKSILVATGASLNVAYAFEHPKAFKRNGMQYQRFEEQAGELVMAHDAEHCKSQHFGPFTSYQNDKHRVTFIGDTHPVFHGNVVKAIASAKRSYPIINEHLKTFAAETNNYDEFAHNLKQQFTTVITGIKRLHKNVLELAIKAPLLAQQFKPGQFFRAQGYMTTAQHAGDTPLHGEACPLYVSYVDKNNDQLKLLVIEKSVSTRLFSTLSIGENIALMGPAGVRSKISHYHETVMIIGNQDGIAQLLSYGAALKEQNNKVVLLGYFENKEQLFYQKEIETICDQIIWCVATGEKIESRDNDISLQGDCLDGLRQYANAQSAVPMNDIDRFQVIADSELLKAIALLFKSELSPKLHKAPKVFGSVKSPMQCMLKGVCAQCLQWQVDPETGERTKAVFSCSWQDQPLELIDFDNLSDRRSQNQLLENINHLWLDHLIAKHQPSIH
jgi:NADPH-dependent glutamate synthase beta subunit-like oxidoreductase/NAD(P)H-flavin reductase